jgi:hypothetical protein
MRYFGTASGPKVRAAMDCGLLGQIVTPAAGNRLEAGRDWIADNAVFAGRYPGDEPFLAWLIARQHLAAACRFVVAPDVVCDAAATLARSAPMLPRIRALGFPAALVAQNGLEDLDVPWHAFDALFIGGDDAWKLGPAARTLAAEAWRRGKWGPHGTRQLAGAAEVRAAHRLRLRRRDVSGVRTGPQPAPAARLDGRGQRPRTAVGDDVMTDLNPAEQYRRPRC